MEKEWMLALPLSQHPKRRKQAWAALAKAQVGPPTYR
jgi:hypothetical protein